MLHFLTYLESDRRSDAKIIVFHLRLYPLTIHGAGAWFILTRKQGHERLTIRVRIRWWTVVLALSHFTPSLSHAHLKPRTNKSDLHCH